MKRERLFSATEIAEILCDADGLQLGEHEDTHNRIRYMTKRTFQDEFGTERPLLQNGQQIDARGKRAFPTLEVYRAAIFNDLMALSIDVRGLQAVVDAATRKHEITLPEDRAPSLKGATSHGALLDAIRGVSQKEQWLLVLYQSHGGHSRTGRIAARFVYAGGIRNWQEDLAETDAIYGARPTRTFVQIDLRELFGPIIEEIGTP